MSRARYLLLHRAIRNAGDFLIHERARALISHFKPRAILDPGEAWRPLDAQFSAADLRRYRAVIIAGGPGYAPGMKRRYPLSGVRDLPPVVLLAGGSFVMPGTSLQLAHRALADADRRFLDDVTSRSPYLGARDPLTASLLNGWGYSRTLMTGDPAWYDLDRLDSPLRTPTSVRRISYTPPSNPVYRMQAAHVAHALRSSFPDVTLTVVEHRGVAPSSAAMSRELGLEVHDISGSAAGLRLHDQADLHVGYRLHAHLYALSQGQPSYLLAEDSRGAGSLQALGAVGALAFRDSGSATILEPAMRALARLGASRVPGVDLAATLAAKAFRIPDLANELARSIERDLQEGFAAHELARATIRATLPVMREMIDALP